MTESSCRRAHQRACLLVNALLREMLLAMKQPARCEEKTWEYLFGSKQPLVANLQKLVATLDDLKEMMDEQNSRLPSAQEVPLSAVEIKLLTAWLADQNP